jgi:hypothetical protein
MDAFNWLEIDPAAETAKDVVPQVAGRVFGQVTNCQRVPAGVMAPLFVTVTEIDPAALAVTGAGLFTTAPVAVMVACPGGIGVPEDETSVAVTVAEDQAVPSESTIVAVSAEVCAIAETGLAVKKKTMAAKTSARGERATFHPWSGQTKPLI